MNHKDLIELALHTLRVRHEAAEERYDTLQEMVRSQPQMVGEALEKLAAQNWLTLDELVDGMRRDFL